MGRGASLAASQPVVIFVFRRPDRLLELTLYVPNKRPIFIDTALPACLALSFFVVVAPFTLHCTVCSFDIKTNQIHDPATSPSCVNLFLYVKRVAPPPASISYNRTIPTSNFISYCTVASVSLSLQYSIEIHSPAHISTTN